LMVGDSYKWDYKSAKEKGIDALLIQSKYEPLKIHTKRTIKKLSDILKHIGDHQREDSEGKIDFKY